MRRLVTALMAVCCSLPHSAPHHIRPSTLLIHDPAPSPLKSASLRPRLIRAERMISESTFNPIDGEDINTDPFDMLPGKRYSINVGCTLAVETITLFMDDLWHQPGQSNWYRQGVLNVDPPTGRAQDSSVRWTAYAMPSARNGAEPMLGVFQIILRFLPSDDESVGSASSEITWDDIGMSICRVRIWEQDV